MSIGLETFVHHGFANVDTNPSNFLFKDGQVYRVDFGCIKEWELGLHLAWLGVLRAIIANDQKALMANLKACQFVADESGFDPQWEMETARLILVKDQSGRLTSDQVRAYVERVAHHNKNAPFARIPPGLIFFYRGIWGLFGLMTELGAAADWQDQLAAKLAEAELRKAV